MANIQQCRSCGAPVIWLKNFTTGKPAPIDAEPSANGNIQIGIQFYAIVSQLQPEDRRTDLHTSHFMTCPQAKTWRKSGYHQSKEAK